MKRVFRVILILIPYLLLGALVIAGVIVMKTPVTQKSIDLLEKGMTFAEVWGIFKSDIVITPISAEDIEKIEYQMYPAELEFHLGDDYEIDSWRDYKIYEWQMDDGESFMVFVGKHNHDTHKVARYWTTRTEWERERRDGREFDENDESIKLDYIYVTEVTENGFFGSLGYNNWIFFEYNNADKFFNEFNSLAVYYDEDTLVMREGTFDTRDGRGSYDGKVRAVSARFTDPEKGEPQFG